MSKMSLIFALTLITGPASAAVYKCDDGAGNITYSQSPCAVNAEEMDISDTETSTPDSGNQPGLRPGEIQKLEEIKQREERRQLRRKQEALQLEHDTETSQKSHYDKKRCNYYSDKLDEVKRDLRRGYTRREEAYLRKRKRNYKRYIDIYCE